MVTEDKLWP